MGLYVNPREGRKEDWLEMYGKEVSYKELVNIENLQTYPMPNLPIVLMDNGAFTAAGICVTPQDLFDFTQPDDTRPKRFFIVPTKELIKVEPAVLTVLTEADNAD